MWNGLHGAKDDILIFDRCGQVTFHIRLPYSNLTYTYVESRLRATYNRAGIGRCLNCPRPEPTEEAVEEVIGTTELMITDYITATSMSDVSATEKQEDPPVEDTNHTTGVDDTVNSAEETAPVDRDSATAAKHSNHNVPHSRKR